MSPDRSVTHVPGLHRMTANNALQRTGITVGAPCSQWIVCSPVRNGIVAAAELGRYADF